MSETSSSCPAASSPPFPAGIRAIALVGLMGAGKSAIGRRLATRLGLPFKDADAEIEAAAGCTIEEYFARYGEPAFRAGERRVIARLIDEAGAPQKLVLATGGGAFMDPETRRLLKAQAVTVWLKAPLEVLLARTARRNNRPLLKGASNPREVLEALMALRYPVYAEADVTIESNDRPADETVERVLQSLEACGALPVA